MKKITVIEDNHEVRENLVEILELSGYDVSEAENGKEGVERVKEVHPDLILCDVMMPVLDGFGVLKILSSHPELMHIPFMFLTAKSEKADFRKGMGLGADDYITKPFDDVELLESIEIRLKKSASVQSLPQEEGNRTFFNEAKGAQELLHLADDKEQRTYSKKDVVYECGHFPKWIFYVESGQVKSFQTNDFGKELITHIYGPGDFFGYIPLLTGSAYKETTATTVKSVLRMVPPEDFKLLLFNDKDFAANFIKVLAQHAEYTGTQLIEMSYSSVRRKVANALVTLLDKTEGSVFKIMREDLASLAGTAKESTIRTLSDFKAEGLVSLENGVIEIIDAQGLRGMPQ